MEDLTANRTPANSSRLNVVIACREALRLLAGAREHGIRIFPSTQAFEIWQGPRADAPTQWGVWSFLPLGWESWPLDRLACEWLTPACVQLALAMPRELPTPAKILEAPEGVQACAIESYQGLQLRALLDWLPVDGAWKPRADYSELHEHYNFESDLLERRACALVLRLDVTRKD